MEKLRRSKAEVFNLLDRVATDQHNQLLKHLLEQLTPHMSAPPDLVVLKSAHEQLNELAEAAVELEMRGKTPDLIDFGGYTLIAPLKAEYPFQTLYLTRPFTNKLVLTALPAAPPREPVALWLNLNPTHTGFTSTGFNPYTALTGHRGPAPCLPPYITDPTELISTAILLRESLETSSINLQTTNTLLQKISHPLEEEIGQRFFPPLQVARSGADNILRPENYLLHLPMVPLIATHAVGPDLTLLQLETVPSWPTTWVPEEAFQNSTDRVVIIGEGINYDIPVLLSLMKELVIAITKQGQGSEEYHDPSS